MKATIKRVDDPKYRLTLDLSPVEAEALSNWCGGLRNRNSAMMAGIGREHPNATTLHVLIGKIYTTINGQLQGEL